MARNRGLLTDTQREALQGEPQHNQAERQIRSRVREQIRNALVIDSPILLHDLRKQDRQQIFESLKPSYKTQEKYLMSKGEQAEERKKRHAEAIEAEPGVAALLAFLYIGLEERSLDQRMGSFKDILKTAMEQVARWNGWELDEFNFTVEFDRNPELEAMQRRFYDEDKAVTTEEVTTLVRHDLITAQEFVEYIDSL